MLDSIFSCLQIFEKSWEGLEVQTGACSSRQDFSKQMSREDLLTFTQNISKFECIFLSYCTRGTVELIILSQTARWAEGPMDVAQLVEGLPSVRKRWV